MKQKEFSAMTKAELLEYLDGEPQDVYQAINAVMARVGYVQKEEAQALPYSFASEPAFISAVRPHMVDVGLMLYQSQCRLLDRHEFTSKKGTAGTSMLFHFQWTWVHTPSGTSFNCTSIGEGMDYGDKAANKAMTVGLKYAMRQTLVIETGDDPDHTGSGEYERGAKSKEATDASGGKRQQYQWEQPIIEKLVDLGLANAKQHAVATLEQSPFKETPFGSLEMVEAVAYCAIRTKLREEFPKIESQERADMANEEWLKGNNEHWLDKATEMLNAGEGKE